VEENELRKKVDFYVSPLLELALSLLVIVNPERFTAAGSWVERITGEIDGEVLAQLREYTRRTDPLALACDLDANGLGVGDALEHIEEQERTVGSALKEYWAVFAPEAAANTGIVAESIKEETARLSGTSVHDFITDFSDRVTISEEGQLLNLEWGKGMQIPLEELDRLLLVPSPFCPRRLMFYRHGAVEYFFYNPLYREGGKESAEPPESLVLGFSALADATRLKLLKLIAREELPAQEMSQRLELHESTVSRHLKFLVEAGLVARERTEGKFIIYSLNMTRIDTLGAALRSYIAGSGF
jgi:ArsR family transcriptional regulator